ncbi:molybdenum cofactor guanylyltransferase [Nocardioides coralli]|uniref:molybdenum cofactor guanylyltransferase n=1 Tax=Nocardioides coralli TaxID=2872154 RepID=UPI001CA40F52|nr:NTP transferase domain-containing protein [Nocardioides coralli]QZY29276.1 NTP transferase domain-containing protein [Nocardioides coralli]
MDLAAVILAGGTAARLDGADKASIEYAGTTFLERALAATGAAGEVVVVGAPVPTSRPATFVREDPPLGGPVAGLAAGRAALAHDPGLLLVLAVDMPRVTAATFDRLLAALPGHDGAVLCDADGRRQLALALAAGGLDRALPQDPHGFPLHRLLSELDLVDVPARNAEAQDVDTWQDLARMLDP